MWGCILPSAWEMEAGTGRSKFTAVLGYIINLRPGLHKIPSKNKWMPELGCLNISLCRKWHLLQLFEPMVNIFRCWLKNIQRGTQLFKIHPSNKAAKDFLSHHPRLVLIFTGDMPRVDNEVDGGWAGSWWDSYSTSVVSLQGSWKINFKKENQTEGCYR